MQQLIGRQRYPLYMNTVALVTILSGVYLIVVASGGLLPSWFRTGPGLGFTLGAVVGIAVFSSACSGSSRAASGWGVAFQSAICCLHPGRLGIHLRFVDHDRADPR